MRPQFEIEETRDDAGALRWRLLGELDLATVPILQLRLQAAAQRRQAVVLDLSELEFLDSSGLRLLLTADAQARRDDWSLRFSRPGERILRIFTVAGVASLLAFED